MLDPQRMRYLPEPKHRHGAVARTAVLLINLGTQDAPTPRAVRRYLAQFLSDPRVIEIPQLLWLPILHAFVLNSRPRKSAQKYASIWTSEGSPLRVHTERQARLLRGHIESRIAIPLTVEFAMRYGEPSIGGTLARVKAAGCERVLVLPMYPQYAASTTASAVDQVAQLLRRTRNVPEIPLGKPFHDPPSYVHALANLVQEHWRRSGRPDKLVMSFHRLPRFSLFRGAPYHRECHETAHLLAPRLEPSQRAWQITFQSRLVPAAC